jgi:hypothetical protein
VGQDQPDLQAFLHDVVGRGVVLAALDKSGPTNITLNAGIIKAVRQLLGIGWVHFVVHHWVHPRLAQPGAPYCKAEMQFRKRASLSL